MKIKKLTLTGGGGERLFLPKASPQSPQRPLEVLQGRAYGAQAMDRWGTLSQAVRGLNPASISF